MASQWKAADDSSHPEKTVGAGLRPAPTKHHYPYCIKPKNR